MHFIMFANAFLVDIECVIFSLSGRLPVDASPSALCVSCLNGSLFGLPLGEGSIEYVNIGESKEFEHPVGAGTREHAYAVVDYHYIALTHVAPPHTIREIRQRRYHVRQLRIGFSLFREFVEVVEQRGRHALLHMTRPWVERSSLVRGVKD